jgi:hypothetical protein
MKREDAFVPIDKIVSDYPEDAGQQNEDGEDMEQAAWFNGYFLRQ